MVDQFFHKIGSYFAKQGFIDASQVTIDTLVGQVQLWTTLMKNEPCRFTQESVGKNLSGLNKRLGNARKIFHDRAGPILRRLFSELPADDSLAKVREGKRDSFFLTRIGGKKRNGAPVSNKRRLLFVAVQLFQRMMTPACWRCLSNFSLISPIGTTISSRMRCFCKFLFFLLFGGVFFFFHQEL